MPANTVKERQPDSWSRLICPTAAKTDGKPWLHVAANKGLTDKETILVLEKAGGMLWYAWPYEGFEANEHVVYMHACPNRHLVLFTDIDDQESVG